MMIIGVLGILIAALGCALYSKFNEGKKISIPTRIVWQYIIASIIILVIFTGNVDIGSIGKLTPIGWIMIFTLVGVVSITAYLFWIKGITRVGSLHNGIIDFIEPITGVCLAIIIFNETLTLLQILGWLIVFFVIYNIKKVK